MANTTITKRTVKKAEEKPAEKKTFTDDEIAAVLQTEKAQDFMQAMIKKALEEQKAQQTVIAAPVAEEMVSLLYMGNVAEGSMVHLNDTLGEIQGRGGLLYIPKRVFLQNLTQPVQRRLKNRRLIVTDGLTDEERERYGVKYEDGELLSQDIYKKLFSYDDDKICEIFDHACRKHKEIIVTLFIDAYQAGHKHVTQSLVERLNEISKKTDPNGMFRAILKDMARVLADR